MDSASIGWRISAKPRSREAAKRKAKEQRGVNRRPFPEWAHPEILNAPDRSMTSGAACGLDRGDCSRTNREKFPGALCLPGLQESGIQSSRRSLRAHPPEESSTTRESRTAAIGPGRANCLE